jgi:peptide/nickel transport system substrate-binding protein
MRKSIIAVIIAIIIVVAAVTAYYYYPKPASQSTETTFTFAEPYDPTTCDPAIAVSSDAALVTRGVYENLLTYKGNTTEIQPVLATSWTVTPDAKVWTFSLRQNVKFQDGTPFNASAVKFSFERLLNISLGDAWMFQEISNIVEVDTYTVQFNLSKSFAPFLATLASQWGPLIVSPSYVIAHELNATELGQKWMYDHACGTGPYMLQSWTHEQTLVMVKNPDYWQGWQGNHIDKIVMQIVSESATRRLLLEKGDIDLAWSLSTDDMVAEQNNTKIALVNAPSTDWIDIRFDCAQAPTNNTLVRQALCYAFDYDTAISQIFPLTGVQARSPLTVNMFGHNPNSFVYHQNITKAKELLAEAGYPNGGFTVTLDYLSTRDFDRALSLLFQSNLAELNITVQMQGYQWTELRPIQTDINKCPNAYVEVWYSDYQDPDDWYRALYYTNSSGANGWNAWYSNSTVDQLIDQAATTSDTATRASLYYQIEAMIIQDAPCIMIADNTYITPMNLWVKGFVGNAAYMYTYDYYALHIEGRS